MPTFNMKNISPKKIVKDVDKSIKSKVMEILNTSKSKSECMSKLKAMDKKGGTKWGDPGYMKSDVFNALISCCLGVPSGLAAAAMTPLGLFGIPVGVLGLYLTGQVFHLNATKYDKFHLLEYYDHKIKKQIKKLEAAKKTTKDPKMKKEIDERIKEGNKALKAIDKERRKLLPKPVRQKAAGFDDLDDFDFDWDDDWLDDDDEFDDIDLEESTIMEASSSKLKPVYLVTSFTYTTFGNITRKLTGAEYSHACISLDPSMENMYTFNASKKGLSVESLSDYAKAEPRSIVRISCIFLKEEDFETLRLNIGDYLSNIHKTGYDWFNLLRVIRNRSIEERNKYKMICSQFIDYILKSINVDITDTSSNLVTPEIISKVNNPKVYVLYEGLAKDYDMKKVDSMTKALAKGGMIAIKESANKYLKVTPVFEAKEWPVGFDEEGNLLIRKRRKINYKEEHAKSKKLFPIYDKHCNYEAMAYEADKLWYMNILIMKEIEACDMNKDVDVKKKEELITMRSKILNEFNLYIHAITKHEANKDYNFEIHFENSPFSDASVKITGSTLKYIMQYAKKIIVG